MRPHVWCVCEKVLKVFGRSVSAIYMFVLLLVKVYLSATSYHDDRRIWARRSALPRALRESFSATKGSCFVTSQLSTTQDSSGFKKLVYIDAEISRTKLIALITSQVSQDLVIMERCKLRFVPLARTCIETLILTLPSSQLRSRSASWVRATS